MVDRVDKFLLDSDGIIGKFATPAAANKSAVLNGKVDPKKAKTLSTECERICTWLQKHQDENLPDGHKDKVVQIIQKYRGLYKLCAASPMLCPPEGLAAVREKVASIMEVYLMLPEGKLTTGKQKKNVLKWLGETQQDATGLPPTSKAQTLTLELCDANARAKDYTLTLMDPALGGDSEVTCVLSSKKAFVEVNTPFEEGKVVMVTIDPETNGFVSFEVEE